MDFGEMLRVLRRRWIISVVGLLLTVFAAVALWVERPITYQSSAEISLLGSPSGANLPGNGGNPWLAIGNLDGLANVLAQDLTSPLATQQLQAQGVTYPYTAQVPAYAAGPFVQITVTGPNQVALLQDLPIIIRYSHEQLIQMQENLPTPTPKAGIVGTSVISPPSAPTPILKKKIELSAGAAIAGLVATLLLSFGVDARARRRDKALESSGTRQQSRRPYSQLGESFPYTGGDDKTRDREPAPRTIGRSWTIRNQ